MNPAHWLIVLALTLGHWSACATPSVPTIPWPDRVEMGKVDLLQLATTNLQAAVPPGEESDPLTNVAQIQAKALAGDAAAQCRLGMLYSLGKNGMPKDPAEAVKWFRRAAEQNHGQAQFLLGQCYSLGHGVPKDRAQFAAWMRRAVENHYYQATPMLVGLGIVSPESQDPVEAYKWYWIGLQHADEVLGPILKLGLAPLVEPKLTPDQVALAIRRGQEFFLEHQSPAARQSMARVQRRAASGDREAQYALGFVYENGIYELWRNPEAAVPWYQKAAVQNHGLAFRALAISYRDGKGVPKNPALAEQWSIFANEYNPAGSNECNLDPAAALDRLRANAEQKDRLAQFWLGERYLRGRGVETNPAVAMQWYLKAAQQQLPDAQYSLAFCYLNGWGVTRDPRAFIKWLRKAADEGHAGAADRLGSCYFNGEFVKTNFTQAARWLGKAADRASANGWYNLGFCHFDGLGLTKNPTNAVNCWYRAALLQHTQAMCQLGYCYSEGAGVEKDPAKALTWWRRAAVTGNMDAQCNIGMLYEDGVGIGRDYVEAVKWYRLSANQGNAQAQRLLGQMYAEGRGVAKDEAEALRWLGKSADQGYAGAFATLSWYSVLAGRIGEARDYALKGMTCAGVRSRTLGTLNLNLGHALLYLGQQPEALKKYRLALKNGVTKQVFLDDFAELKTALPDKQAVILAAERALFAQ